MRKSRPPTDRKRCIAVTGMILWIMLVVTFLPAHAQRYSFKSYTREQGLTTTAVMHMLQDRNGLIWVGTQNGLFWYDGKSFREVVAQEPFFSKYIMALHETAEGSLWRARGRGIVGGRGNSLERGDLGEPIAIQGTGILASDKDNHLYVAAAQGLVRLETSDQGASYRVKWISRRPAHSAGLDAEGKVWFGCDESLCRLDSSEPVNVTAHYQLPQETWDSIITDEGGNLWTRSARRLFELLRSTGSFVSRDQGLPPTGAPAAVLSRAGDGSVLVPTDVGLAMQVEGHWKVVNTSSGLVSDSVSCALRDREGSLWIGLRGIGVQRWLGFKQWKSWTKAEGLSSDVMWDIKKDSHGVLWAGTNYGLNALDPRTGTWRSWHERNGLPGEKIRAIAIDRMGGVWVGAYPGGVAWFDSKGKHVATYRHESGLTADN